MTAPTLNNYQQLAAPAAEPAVMSYTVSSGGSDKILVLGIGVEDGEMATFTVDSVTFGSDTLTLADVLTSGTYQRTYVYYKINPTVQTADITVNYSGNDNNRVNLGAMYLTDAKQTDQPDATDTTGGGPGGTQVDVVTTVSDCFVMAFWSSNSGLTGTTTGGTFFSVLSGNSQSFRAGYVAATDPDTYSLKIDITDDRTVAVGVAFRPLAAGGGGEFPFHLYYQGSQSV